MLTPAEYDRQDRNARGVAKAATEHLRFNVQTLTVWQLDRLTKADDANDQGYPVSGDVLARLSRHKTI